MKATTIRFSDTAHALLEEGARAQGVSFAQYVREAAVARWALEAGARAGAGRRDVDRDRLEALREGLAELRRIGIATTGDGA